MASEEQSAPFAMSNDESIELCQQLVAASPDAIVVLQDGRYAFVNAAFRRKFQYTRQDVAQGLSFFELVDEGDQEAVGRRYEDRLAGVEVPQTFLLHMIAKDGSRTYCETSAAMIQYRGRPADLVIIRDITERQRTEEDLVAKRRVLDALAGFSKQVLEPNLDSVLQNALNYIRGSVGAPRVSIALRGEQGDGLRLIRVPDVEGPLPTGIFVPAEGVPHSEVIRTRKPMYRPDIEADERRWELDRKLLAVGVRCAYMVPLVVEDLCLGTLNCATHQVDGIAAADRQLLDLLASRLALAIRNAQLFDAIRGNEAHVRALLENSEDVIFVTDREGTVRWVSASAERLRGQSAEELLGTNAFEGVHSDDQAHLQGLLFELLAHPKTVMRMECRVRHQDGSWRVQEGTMNNLLDDPRVAGIVVNSRDVTERRALQQDVQRREKLESLGLLAGGLAHDFNNLLTVIYGSIGLAKRSLALDSVARLRLDVAENASQKAAEITRQLLAFARGGEPIKRTAAIEELAREAASLVFHGSNVRCEFDVPAPSWPAPVDVGQMSQVFHNLLINADQAMPDGGIVRVRIENVPSAGREGGGGARIRITIQDEGAGIDEADLPLIFDPYFTTKPSGSGLGLPTAHAIIKRHDGAIHLQSPGSAGGTCFVIELPAEPEGVVVDEPKGGEPCRGHGRILVMDDDQMVQSVVGLMLAELGYEVAFVADGQQALDAYRRSSDEGQPFDAVILDLTVPGSMGGKIAVKRLLALDPTCVAIVSSGYSDDPVMARYREHGFVGVVHKPYTLHELGRTLHDALRSQDDEG